MKQDKRETFKRLAESRINKILTTINLLGNLSMRSNYSYDKKDIDKMKEAIETALDKTWTEFDRGGMDKPEKTFKL